MRKNFYSSLGVMALLISTAVYALSEEDKQLIEKANRASEAKPKIKKTTPVHKEQPKPKPVKEHHPRKKPVREVEEITTVSVVPMTEEQIQEQIAKIDADMVKLPNGKWMGKYEVTQAQWQAVMGNNPSHFKKCGDNCPVEEVSYNDVQVYIQKLNEKTGKSYRLPTEEEWFAARQAGQTTEYCGSNIPDEVAWYDGNSGRTTHPVGQKTPNAWGLHDMSGNVWEWTARFYDNSNTHRVVRGGSWGSIPYSLCSADRFNFTPVYRFNDLGFRLSR